MTVILSAAKGRALRMTTRTSARLMSETLDRRQTAAAARPRAQAADVEIDDRGRVRRKRLAHDPPAADGDAAGAATLAALAEATRERARAENRRKGRQYDRGEAQQRRGVDRLAR